MGSYLPSPVTEKNNEFYSNGKYDCSVSYMQGWRPHMEDEHVVEIDLREGISLFALFDGHGDSSVSKYLKENFAQVLTENEEFKSQNYQPALMQTFRDLDYKIKTEFVTTTFAGSTAVVALIVDQLLYVANLGDSRCLLMRDLEVIELTKDHVPSLPAEQKRIEAAGGFVDDMGKLNCTFAVSRAFGDFEFKSEKDLPDDEQMVISVPEIRKIKLCKDDTFLFLGCDGLFETNSSYSLMQQIDRGLAQGQTQEQTLNTLMDNSLAKDQQALAGFDNMTCILVTFKH